MAVQWCVAVIVADGVLAQFVKLFLSNVGKARAAFLVIGHVMAENQRAGRTAFNLAGNDRIQHILGRKDDEIDAINRGRVVEHQAVPRSLQEAGRSKLLKNGCVARREILNIAALIERGYAEEGV